MYKHLARILQEIEKRFTTERPLQYRKEFENTLNHLPILQKDFIVKNVLKMNWNVGSCATMELLQTAGILSIGEYLLVQPEESIQLILMDILESNYTLLANLVQHLDCNTHSSIKIATILEEAFRLFVLDLIDQPTIVQKLYLKELKQIVRMNSTFESVCRIHLNILINAKENNIQESIGLQKRWNEELPKNGPLVTLINEIVENQFDSLKHLFDYALTPNFNGWQFYLHCLRIICCKLSESAAKEIKLFLKNLFKKSVERKSMSLFFVLILTGRQVCWYDSNYQCGYKSYQQWYKQTFGDMQYHISVPEFKEVLNFLTELIGHENDPDMLDVHGSVSISAPKFCNEFVLIYKKSCRTAAEHLRLESGENTSVRYSDDDIDDVFLID